MFDEILFKLSVCFIHSLQVYRTAGCMAKKRQEGGMPLLRKVDREDQRKWKGHRLFSSFAFFYFPRRWRWWEPSDQTFSTSAKMIHDQLERNNRNDQKAGGSHEREQTSSESVEIAASSCRINTESICHCGQCEVFLLLLFYFKRSRDSSVSQGSRRSWGSVLSSLASLF